MPATVGINEVNGGAGGVTTTGIANLNYGNVDAPNITVSGTTAITRGNNSFEKSLAIQLVTLSTSTQISNFQLWISAGAYVAGETIRANIATAGVYTNMTAGVHTAYSTNVTTATTRATVTMPVAAPLAQNLGIAGVLGTALTVIGGVSDFFVTQTQTTVTASPGLVNAKTFTFQYDEA